MTPEEDSSLQKTIRIITVAPFLLVGTGLIILGIVMYFRLGADERDFNAKMQSIHAGQISPETLTVIEKHINPSRDGTGHPHVIFSGNHSPRVNLPSTRTFYDSVAIGSPVTAYYFSDGYFVPQSQGGQAGTAKWIIPSTCLTIGVAVLAVGSRARRSSANARQLAAAIQALAGRGDQ